MSANVAQVVASEPSNRNGYRSFRLGRFELSRDEYFVTVHWPAKGARRSHQMPADAFLRACMRDVAWNFFYGWVNFDHVIGTNVRSVFRCMREELKIMRPQKAGVIVNFASMAPSRPEIFCRFISITRVRRGRRSSCWRKV